MTKQELIEAISTVSPSTAISVDATVKQLTALLKKVETEKTKELSQVKEVKKSLQLADKLTVQAGKAHELTLAKLKALGVDWKNITRYLQLVVFAGEYPLGEKKDKEGNLKPLPVTVARSTSEAGRIVNCFNSYRSKYSDYDTVRQRIEPRQPAVTPEPSKAGQELIDKKKEDKTTSKAVVIDKKAIPAALALMFSDVKDDFVKDSLLVVADYYNVDLKA